MKNLKLKNTMIFFTLIFFLGIDLAKQQTLARVQDMTNNPTDRYMNKFTTDQENQDFNTFLIKEENRAKVIQSELDSREDEVDKAKGSDKSKIQSIRQKITQLLHQSDSELRKLRGDPQPSTWREKSKVIDSQLDQAEKLLDQGRTNS